ncbi:hypothetical protein [Sodalis ligni]|uniref:hypothetical protein n=1 Tax=Sodalis ligni TaxID=2697027 RepID=UPI00104FCD8A|nr:hypothetical protein [Sodalis ligni]
MSEPIVSNYAYVENGIVTNVIVWDGVTQYNPGPNVTLVLLPPDSPVTMGYLYKAATGFTEPANPDATQQTEPAGS